MFDKEMAQRRRDQFAVMRGEVFFQGRGGRGSANTGRGRIGANRGGASGGRANEVKSESCFKCGEADHCSRECPRKDSVCTWCGAIGHLEKTCYNKTNGSARGGKKDGRGGRGRGRGGGYSRIGEEGEEEEQEQGHLEALIGEVNMGTSDGDCEDKEWVCDSRADFYMSGDISLFDYLEPIPSAFYIKQIMGTVVNTQWGIVRVNTNGGGGVKKELTPHEAMFMPVSGYISS